MPKRRRLSKVAREVFEDATTEILGSSFCAVLFFHLKRRFGKDPYEVFVDEPKIFYSELEKIFSNGAEAIVRSVGQHLADKYHIGTRSPGEFAKLVAIGDEPSKNEMLGILAKVYADGGGRDTDQSLALLVA